MQNYLSFSYKLLLPEYYLFNLFIAQNKKHMGEMSFPAGGSVFVLLSRRSSEAEGHSEAVVLHWALQDSDGSAGALRLAQMLWYIHGFQHS